MYEFVTVYHRKDVKKNPSSRNINEELFWSVQKLLKFLRIYSHPWMVMENRNSILVIFTFENYSKRDLKDFKCMTVSLDVFRNFLRLLWDFQISKIHWIYLTQLNLFESTESIWLNWIYWIYLTQLNLFESIESFWNDWIYLKQYSN